eukprot:gene15119-20346_t
MVDGRSVNMQLKCFPQFYVKKSNDSQNAAVYDISAIDETITNTFIIAMEKEIISIILPAYRMGFGDCSSVGSCVLIAVQTSDNRLVVMNCGIVEPFWDEEQYYISTRINREHNAKVPFKVYGLQRFHLNVVVSILGTGVKVNNYENLKINHNEEQYYVSARVNREHNARVPLKVYEL